MVACNGSTSVMADLEARVALDVGARTDVGCVRENNEDSFALAPELNIFVLSDGMGGQASGEVASRLVTETIIAHARAGAANPSLEFSGERIEGVSEISNRLAASVRLANRAVREAAERSATRRGMGATVVAVQFAQDRMSLAHVGDSRAYRWRRGEFEQLTHDHSFVAEQVRQGMMTEEEANSSKLQNVLLRALGVEPEVKVDVSEELMMEGDAVLLCSDGLTRELSDAQIAAILAANHDAQKAAEQLVEMAKKAGGNDNVTVIVIRRAPKHTSAFERISNWLWGSWEPS